MCGQMSIGMEKCVAQEMASFWLNVNTWFVFERTFYYGIKICYCVHMENGEQTERVDILTVREEIQISRKQRI